MDDLDLVKAARTRTPAPTDAATAAARERLRARMQRPTWFSFRPRFSPLTVSIATVAAVAVVATIAFTAFGQGVKGLHDPAIAPSPTPTATGAVWTSPPQIAFDDDCSTVFSTGQVAAILGTPDARLVDPDAWGTRTSPTRAVIPHNGGLWCMWNDTTTDDGTASGSAPWIMAVVLPASALPNAVASDDCVAAANGTNSCEFTVASDGYVLAGTMGRGDRDQTTMTDVAIPALADAFSAATKDAGPPPAPYATREGDWNYSYDCASLFTSAQVWQSFGGDVLPATETDLENFPTAINDELTHGHGLTSCISGDYGNLIGVDVLPAGSWLDDRVAAQDDIEQILVDGADSAYRLYSEGEEGSGSTVWAFSGPNLLVVSSNSEEMATLPVAGLLRELDGEPAAPTSEPNTPYTGTATCTNLLDASTVGELEAGGRHDRGEAFTEKITDEPEQELHSFLVYGGIVCGWATDAPDDEQQPLFGYGPITAEQADAEREKLVTRGYVRTAYRGGETWTSTGDNSYGTWVIGDGYWAVGTESAVGNVIDQVIANAPEWKNLTSAKGKAATPASAPYLTTEGLGALRIGQKVPANPYAEWNEGCWINSAGDVHPPVIIRTSDRNSEKGTLDWIYMTDGSTPTKSGVRVGDTIETLLATYGTFDKIREFSDTTGYIINGEAGKIVFEVLRVIDDTPDRPNGTIVSIEVYAKSYGVESVHGNGAHAVCLG